MEKVIYDMASETWNDSLLLPEVMKEDPRVCGDFMMEQVIKSLIPEVLKEIEQDKKQDGDLSPIKVKDQKDWQVKF
jgi:hypothetical protein